MNLNKISQNNQTLPTQTSSDLHWSVIDRWQTHPGFIRVKKEH